jgi:hypothetical protein
MLIIITNREHAEPLPQMIEKIHNVNVLAFSWPSHPYVRSNETQISIGVIEKAIKAALGILFICPVSKYRSI